MGATLPTDVTRTGYTFKGWYDNENLTGSPVNHPLIQYASIPEYITADFPPTFITDGNYDPLLPHSMVLTKALRDAKVSVDPLFFSRDYRPLLLHEYQFNINTKAGQLCFERILKFVAAHTK